MTDFTRLTVIGTVRRAELVVPDDEAVGSLLPRLMELLDEPAGPVARPLTLVRVTGEQLDAALTAAEQQVVDGEQLRLLRADDAPPPPEVADVTDVVGDSYDERGGRWSATARHTLAALGIGSSVCIGLLVQPVSAAVGVGALLVLALAAVLLGRTSRDWPAIVCTAAAAGAAIPITRTLVRGSDLLAGADPGALRLAWVAVAAVAVWMVLGVGVGAGLRSRPAVPGAVLGAGLLAVPLLLAAAGLPVERALTIGTVAAVVACGLLPWWALSASGLTGLDDQVLAGRPSRRPQVLRTVDDAYRTLSWSAVAVALPLGVGAALLAGSANRWTMVIGLVTITVTALRTRAFPLIVQQFALGLAAVTATTVALLTHRPTLTATQLAGALIALAVVIAVGAGVRPAAHHRARLRRFGNLVEALAVISLAPLLLGSFGVFTDLIGAFR